MLGMSVQDLTLQKPKRLSYCFLVLVVCSVGVKAPADQSDEIILSNEYWSVKVSPGTLEMSAELTGGDKILLSKGRPDLGPVSNIVKTGYQRRWVLETKGIKVDVRLDRRD